MKNVSYCCPKYLEPEIVALIFSSLHFQVVTSSSGFMSVIALQFSLVVLPWPWFGTLSFFPYFDALFFISHLLYAHSVHVSTSKQFVHIISYKPCYNPEWYSIIFYFPNKNQKFREISDLSKVTELLRIAELGSKPRPM